MGKAVLSPGVAGRVGVDKCYHGHMTSTYNPQANLDIAILVFDPNGFARALDEGARLDVSGAREPADGQLSAGMQLLYGMMAHGRMQLAQIAEEKGHDLKPYVAQLRLELLPGCMGNKGSNDVLRFLLERWPNDDWKRPCLAGGNTLLHAIAGIGKRRYLKMLMEMGVEVDTANDLGQTALHLARSRMGINTLLLEGKADRLAQDSRGNTALMLASQRLVNCLARNSGVGSITAQDLTPVFLLAGQDGLLNDPKAKIVARRLDKVRKAGLGEVPTVPMELIWNQVDAVIAGQRRHQLGKVSKQIRGRRRDPGRMM